MNNLAKDLSEVSLSPCSLRPHRDSAFFVAWNGVIVLVWEGFPAPLLDAKRRAERLIPNLKQENFGSKWTKTTIGALHDNCDAFTLEEMETLQNICKKNSFELATLKVEMAIKTISLVNYQCRSLERLVEPRCDVDLTSAGVSETVTPQERQIVDGVVSEWNDLPSYLEKVNAPGSRLGSYRNDWPGQTMVAFCNQGQSMESFRAQPLMQTLKDFQVAVDRAFPGRYAWFKESSLHCSLRVLDHNA